MSNTFNNSVVRIAMCHGICGTKTEQRELLYTLPCPSPGECGRETHFSTGYRCTVCGTVEDRQLGLMLMSEQSLTPGGEHHLIPELWPLSADRRVTPSWTIQQAIAEGEELEVQAPPELIGRIRQALGMDNFPPIAADPDQTDSWRPGKPPTGGPDLPFGNK